MNGSNNKKSYLGYLVYSVDPDTELHIGLGMFDTYGGEDEILSIRKKLPKKVINNDLKTGVAVF